MHIDNIREYCLSKKAVTESFPFDSKTLVFKVGDKIFSIAILESIPLKINLKCEPERALDLREQYESVQGGYHSNKKHWNTIELDGEIPKELIFTLIDHSYELVVSKLTKKNKRILFTSMSVEINYLNGHY